MFYNRPPMYQHVLQSTPHHVSTNCFFGACGPGCGLPAPGRPDPILICCQRHIRGAGATRCTQQVHNYSPVFLRARERVFLRALERAFACVCVLRTRERVFAHARVFCVHASAFLRARLPTFCMRSCLLRRREKGRSVWGL